MLNERWRKCNGWFCFLNLPFFNLVFQNGLKYETRYQRMDLVVPAPPLSSCVTLGESIKFSWPKAMNGL